MKVLVVILFTCLGVAAAAVYRSSSESSSQDVSSDSSSQDDYYLPKPKKCYNCAYTPPKNTTKEVKVPRKILKKVKHDDGYYKKWVTVYDVKEVPQNTTGGWEKCYLPFSHEEATEWGIDAWDCEGNCFVRQDKNNDLFRGCYTGTFGVDQNKIGCHEQAGSNWCFCEGDLCNNMNGNIVH